jgi:predicted MFS family arabinose efflux permease
VSGGPTEQERDVAAPVRGSLGLLTDRVFGPFFVGKLLSTAGIWIHNIVAAILAFQLTRSAFVVGLVSVAQFLPQLLFAPLSGAVADRGDRRKQLVLGRLIAAAGSGGLALWIALAGVEGLPGAAPVVGAALVVGIGFVVGGPAMHALLPTLVRPGELAAAIALNSVPFTVARAGGPALGALVAASAGPELAFAIAAAANLLFAGVLVWLPIGGKPATSADADRSVRAGLRYLRTDPTLVWLLAGVGAIGIGADPAITLTPPLSDGFGRGAELVGIFASSFGVGAGAAFLVLAPLRRTLGLPRLGTLGLALLATGMLALTVTPVPAAAIVAFGVGGAGMTLSLTSLSTQMQERLPDVLRGRVMALWSVAFLGSRPFAAAVNGAVADAVSVEAALLTVVTVLLVATWLSRPSRLAPVPLASTPDARGVSPADRSSAARRAASTPDARGVSPSNRS